MLIISPCFDQCKAVRLIQLAQGFILINHQKLHSLSTVFFGFLFAVLHQSFAKSQILIFGQYGKTTKGVCIGIDSFQCYTTGDKSVNANGVNVCPASFIGDQLIKRHESGTAGVIFFCKTESFAIDAKGAMNGFQA